MHIHRFRPLALVLRPALVLALALLAGPAWHAAAWAGPVPTAHDDAVGASPVEMAPAGLSAPALDGVAAASAASSPSGSALAAELIKESGAGVHATDAAAPARRAGGGATPASAQPTADGSTARRPAGHDDWGLREWGKATLRWLKQAVPGLRDDADEHGGRSVAPDAADWSASPLDRDPRHAPQRRADASATAAADAALRATPDGPAPSVFFDPEQNLVRMVASAVREVLDHPLTWLVLLLIAVGAVVVKRIDRRPTK